MVERHHLLMVKTIAEQGTVTRAADKLFLTQSALSHAMKKLENSLDTKLWQKSGRKLTLTQAGEKILSASTKILPQFDKLEEEITSLSAGRSGCIKVGIECFPCFQWLLKVVAPFLKHYPKVDIDIKNEFQFGGIGALLNFEIDLLVTPDPLFHKKITYIPIFDYQQVLLVNASDELAKKSEITPHDLAEKTLFTYPVERERLDVFTRFLTPEGGSVKQHKTLENTEMILQMVQHGRGVAALPNWLVDHQEGAILEQVKRLPFGAEGIHKTTYIAVRTEESNNPIINQFIEQSKLTR